MKQRVGMFALFALLGAILDVAMAWMFAAWAPTPEHVPFAGNGVPREVLAALPSDYFAPEPQLPNVSSSHSVQIGIGITLIESRITKFDLFGPTSLTTVELCGWPARSWMCSEFNKASETRYAFAMPRALVGGHIALLPKAHDRPLPYYPIWPGFAIDTLFYAAILWLPFAAFGRIRRRRRIKRGLCPACAYPVGTSAVCTECGTSTVPSAADEPIFRLLRWWRTRFPGNRNRIGRAHAAFVDREVPLSQCESGEILEQIMIQEDASASGRWVRVYGAALFIGCIFIMAYAIAVGYPFWLTILIGFMSLMLAGIPIRILTQRSVTTAFRAELRKRGFDICMSCGYWLRGLSPAVGKCPECGAKRDDLSCS